MQRGTEPTIATPVEEEQPASRRSRTWWRIRRNRLSWVGFGITGALVVIAVFAPLVAPYPEAAGANVDIGAALQPPSAEHWFGTDDVGRDVFSRVLIGTRVSLLGGLAVVAAGSVLGVVVGLIAGYAGGFTNVVLMRIADVFLAVPGVALALAFAAVLQPSVTTTIVAITLVWWPWMARLVQSEVAGIRSRTFLEASSSYGASHTRVIVRDILPNITSVIVVKASLDIGFAILLVAALGFLGVGAQPPIPEWGSMIASGRAYLPSSWWLSTFPGIAIFITVMGFNLLGDALRDAFDVSYET